MNIATEICKFRIVLIEEDSVEYGADQVFGADDAINATKLFFKGADREMFGILAMDAKNKPLGFNVAAIGGLSNCPVDVKNVIKFAIMANASAVIVLHNHPSGDPTPSRADRDITRSIKTACEAVGLRLLDHVVIGDKKHYSFCDEGAL